MTSLLKILFSSLILTFGSLLYSQKSCIITGYVTDSTGLALPLANITADRSLAGTYSDDKGYFILSIEADSLVHILEISSLGYNNASVRFRALEDTLIFNIMLGESVTSLEDVVVRETFRREEPTMRKVPIRDILTVPATSGSIETLLKTLPGVNSGNELSNQYSVRGGSYDENLVYLNDIEIYRPVLIHSGKQEGLSIINPDMAGSVEFSTGGFNASYGDRMASVLDISYREPTKFRGSVTASLLTSTAHAEGTALNDHLSFTAGLRYKTNRFLLGTLDTRGHYIPSYWDMQGLVNYSVSDKIKFTLLATHNINSYTFIPQSQRSSFGNIFEAYQLFVNYDGRESDSYRNYNIAFTLEITPVPDFINSFIIHRYSARESETFDIRGSYSLNSLDKNTGSENLGDSIMNIGSGSWLDHARNYLDATITMAAYKSRWEHGDNVLSLGTRLKFENIDDRLKEWIRIDSAGYTIPYSSTGLILTESSVSTNNLSTKRLEAYIIDNYTLQPGNHSLILTGGIRMSYWSFNDELIISPRLSAYWQPPFPGLTVYAAYGTYYQSTFYREMRSPDGIINNDIRSQKSVHYVAGSIFDFNIGLTPVRLTGELYFKEFTDLIPYKFDNVRVIYSGINNARGTARGIDLRLNGEFVKDAESWLSLSLMNVKHDIIGDNLPSYPAPTDARFSASVYFQDYFPSNPTLRAHINMVYSTGVPVSSPYDDRYDSMHRMPAYRRVDLGFSKVFSKTGDGRNRLLPGWVDRIVAEIEIFNLLDINNTISYLWLTTVNNMNGEVRQFAVPNYLTGRSLNLSLTVAF